MLTKISLYHIVTDELKSNVDAFFDGGDLVIDGYDIGKKVDEIWGDSDYEYSLKIPAAGVEFLYSHFNLRPGDREALLLELAKQYHSYSCFSDIKNLLNELRINFEYFSWT